MHVSHVRSVQYGLPNKNKKIKKKERKRDACNIILQEVWTLDVLYYSDKLS